MFHKILVAVDGSKHALRAFEAAMETARGLGASLDIVTVLDHTEAPGTIAAFAKSEHMDSPNQAEREATEATLLRPLQEKAKRSGIKGVRGEVLRGDPAEQILGFAKVGGNDLIVMGRRGLGRVEGLVLGSVSSKLASHASCAVLTVK